MKVKIHNKRNRYLQITIAVGILIVAAVVFLYLYSTVFAATRTWDGEGTTSNWSDCNNWSDNTCPITGDIVVFDNTSDKDSIVDVSFTAAIQEFHQNAGYNGTTTLATGLTVTRDFTMASGTVDLASNTLTLNTAIVGGMVFTISGGNFDTGTGTVAFEGYIRTVDVPTTETFYNMSVNLSSGGNSVVITSGDTIVISNNLTLTNGEVDTGTIDIASGATLTVGSTADGGTAAIQFQQSGDETINCNDGGIMPGLLIDKSSGTLDFSCNNLSLEDDFVLQGGTFSLGSKTLTLSTATIGGITFTISDSGVFDEGMGTVAFEKFDRTIDVPVTETFYNMSVDLLSGSNAIAVTSGDTVIITNNLRLIDGELDTGTVDMQGGTVYASSTFDGGNGVLQFEQAGNETIVCDDNAILPDLLVNKSSDTLNFSCSNLVLEEDFTLQNGTFSLDSNTLTLSTRITGGKTFTISGGTFNEATGTVAFEGFDITVDVPTTETFYNMSVNKGNNTYVVSIPSDDTIIISNNLILTNGRVNTGMMQAQGDVTVASTYDGGSAPLIFKGSGTQTFDLTGGTDTFNADITVNKSGGEVDLASALVMDAANQDLTITEGTFDLSGNDLSVSGSGGTFVVEDGGNLQLQGGETLTEPMLQSGCMVTYDGSGTYASLPVGNTYYSLAIAGTGIFSTSSSLSISKDFTQTAGTWSANGTTTFSGATSTTITTTSSTTFTHININKTGTSTLLAGNDLTATNLLLSNGTLDVTATGCSGASCDITLSGNWTNAGATFTPRSGTVALNGSGQSMTGTTTFYDLTKTTTSTDTLYFGAGQKQTVTNEWTAQGAESNILSLRSTIEDTQWKIDPQNTRTLNYLNVKDSNNTNATVITTYPFSIADGTNNTNWDFSVPPPPEVRIQSGTRLLPGIRLQ